MTTTIDDATMRALRVIIQQELSNAASVQAAAQAIAKGVTQYIGARYVPLFAEPLQWDSTKEYEPLTIVLYQGNSYTTRQYTPAGIEITNEAFWAETGNYNAQIERYRQEVAQFDARITANESNIKSLQNHKSHMVIIGDSFSDQTYLPNGELWCDKLAKALGMTLHNYAAGGAGFIATSDHGNLTFANELSNANADKDFDNEEVGYVIIYGGTNDLRKDTSVSKNTLNNAITQTLNNALLLFPNAQVLYLGSTTFATFKNKTMSDTEIISELTVVNNADSVIKSLGLTCFWIGQDSLFTNGYAGHPNQLGHNEFAKCIINKLNGGCGFTHVLTIEPSLQNDVDGHYTLGVTGANLNRFIVTFSDYLCKFELSTQLKCPEKEWDGIPTIALPYNFRYPYKLLANVNTPEIINARTDDPALNLITNVFCQFKNTNELSFIPRLFSKTAGTFEDIYYTWSVNA